jgi:putative transcriptional regulator
MLTEQQQEQATCYALGALPAAERSAFESALRIPPQPATSDMGAWRGYIAALQGTLELREFLLAVQRSVNLLALASPQVSPPPSLRDKVLAPRSAPDRVGTGESPTPPQAPAPHEDRPSHTAPPLSPGFHFHAAQESAGWKPLPLPGAWIKLLSVDRASGYAVLLGKLDPGVRYPAHTHTGSENLYILTGDLQIGQLALGPGDFHHSDAGTSHPLNHSIEGCTLLAVLGVEHELARFAMREA